MYELYHHGIKGQKWGVRRYQNKDGSLTSEGRKKYGDTENFEAERKKKKAKDVENLRTMRNTSNSAKDLTREVNNIEKERSRKKQEKYNEAVKEKVLDDAKKMTDDELRAAVNRLNMEERYTQVIASREQVDLGKSRAEKYMDRTMTALTLTSTALSIGLMIRELSK